MADFVEQLIVYYGDPAPTTYTVTWKNWDGTELEKDENVAAGATPSYDGETPTKPEDANNTYTFAGWSPGGCPCHRRCDLHRAV